MEDWLIGQDASPIEAATQTASTAASVVKLTSPIIPPNQTEEEKWYILVVTALAGGGAFQNPCMAAVLPGPIW